MQAQVEFNRLLTPETDKSIYQLGLQCVEPLDYQPGDWLKVFVNNPAPLVAEVLAALQLTGQETVTLKKIGEITVFEALQQHLEVRLLAPVTLNKIKQHFLITDWPDRQTMMDYAAGKDLLDLLIAYPQLKGVGVCECLTPLAPRYYSIASSVEGVGSHRVDLVYREVRYQQGQRLRQGLVTTQMAQKRAGDSLEIELSPNRSFKLPNPLSMSDTREPTHIIMVAAGTGIAPFIGFCQQWFASQNRDKNNQAWLFFGETHQATSFLFQSELQDWVKQGLQLHTAFSQDQLEKIYVQDRIWQQRTTLWPLLMKGAHLYVCGSQQKLWSGVEKTLVAIIEDQSKQPTEKAKQTLQIWKKSGQLQLDVY